MSKYVIDGTINKIHSIREANEFEDFAEMKFQVPNSSHIIGYVYADSFIDAIRKFKRMEADNFYEAYNR
jgi:hypothetical protein